MSEIITDLSSSPYWDDYNENKQFYRILFIPKRAVQVREMNQLQQMVQVQISRFADHVFKDGSIVSGCNVTYVPKIEYARCGIFNENTPNSHFTTDVLNDFLVVSNETGLRAAINICTPGFIGSYPQTNIMYVNYLNKGRDSGNNEIQTFQDGELLTIYDKQQDKFGTLLSGYVYNTINVLTPGVDQNAIGQAYGVTVGDGVVYQKGYFVNVLPHSILVNPYSTDTTDYLVGFETQESIITYLQDPSLIDPADTSNRNGIGANRLKLTPVLVSKKRADISSTSDFFPIIEFGDESQPTKQKEDPEYAALGDYINKRNFEVNGDFYVKPFVVNTKDSSSNTQNFVYTIDAGIAYVKGNRVELINTISIETNRGTDLGFFNGNITTLNYGNYVIANQVVGTFNADNLVKVNLYDAAQTSVSSSRNPNSPTGTIIGVANVRAAMFDSGGKGSATANYRIYLTNIVMNSGKSFADVKSISVNATTNGLSYGAAADIVLTNNRAVLQDAALSGLIFNTGVEGTRRLRDSSGVNDTSYTLRDTSTATLQANGSVTFTLNTPYAGGSERFFASPGVLSTGNKERIDITTTAGFVTANLTGRVNGNSGNTTVVGAGTNFTDVFAPGDFIRINSVNYSVVAVNSATNLTVNANVTGGGANNTYAKATLAGSVINLDKTTVTVVSNTQFVVDVGINISTGAPQTLIATYPVIRSEAYEIKKEVRGGTYVKLDLSTAGTDGTYDLGLVDVYGISNIWVGNSYSESNPDRTSWFSFDNGQQATHYDHAKIIIKPAYKDKLTSATRILVKLNHFVANTSTGIGFFSADSYPTRAPGVAANTTNISYDDIPEVFGYNLRDAIDFRPQKFNTAAISNTAAGATINPVASNTTFNISPSGTYIGEPSSNLQSDVEYYLPRIDLIQVNKDGYFSSKASVPASNPKVPGAGADAMPVAIAYIPPYPGITADAIGRFPATKPKIKTSLTGNRGYTQKDIGTLDKRITTLEYYQALSMLEQQAKDYTVKDENGLDRFKNGIFVDPLKNHMLGDVSNFEYNIAIDESMEIARPPIKKNSIDLDVVASSNITTNGRIATIEYERNLYIEQKYASKYRNVVDSVWKWSGQLNLFPDYDYFQDEKSLPSVNVSVDIASPWEDFANSPFAQRYGDWRVVSEDTTSSSAVSSTRRGNTTTTTTETTTTTSTLLEQSNQFLNVGTSITKNDLGSYVTDVALNPYMRSRNVAFIATGLRPNTRFYATFAGESVDSNCAPGVIDSSIYDQTTGELIIDSGKEDSIVTRNSDFGTPLITDEKGNLAGIFNIPDQKFRVGDRIFQLVDVDDISTGGDAILSSAQAMYTASSLTTNKRDVSITTINPTLTTSTQTDTRVDTSTNISQRTNTVVTPAPPSPPRGGGRGSTGGNGRGGSNGTARGDPLGQTFFVDAPDTIPGSFLEAIGVYFKTKDNNLGITCYLTEVTAGVPDNYRVLGVSYLKPESINVSDDSSLETIFKFNEIPYLTKDKFYAMFLTPDANSPNYQIFMSEIGGVDILTGEKIFSNPYIGVAVKSANSDTWTPLQTEDFKFNVYTCKFKYDGGVLTFADQDDEYLTVDGFAFANTNTTIQVGDVVYTANSSGSPLTGNTSPRAFVQEYDQIEDTLHLDSSRGGFTANTKINIYRPADPNNPALVNANNLIATSTIVSVDDIEYSIIVPRVSTTIPFGTNVYYSFKGIDSNGVSDSNWVDVQPETELEMTDKTRYIRSKSNRGSVDNSAQLYVELSTNSSYISPIVNLRRRSMFAISNNINNDLTNEHTRNGNALVRYISRIITLAEGQDAEDMKVLITGYRPNGTDISVYTKILCADDSDNFYDKFWTKMEMTEGSSVYSSSINTTDFREYGFSFPTSEAFQGSAWTDINNNRIVQYRNTAGSISQGYKMFAIKIVLTAGQNYRVPRIDDLRAICTQI